MSRIRTRTIASIIADAAAQADCERYLHGSRCPVDYFTQYGKEIPEHMLPGRFIARMPATDRAALANLRAQDTWDSGMWWATRCCGRQERLPLWAINGPNVG